MPLPTHSDEQIVAAAIKRSTDETALSLPVEGSIDGLSFNLSEADLNIRLGDSEAQF